MSEAKRESFDIGIKAVKLMEHTFTVTSNRKRYPNKYITLIKRIQNKAMDIYELVIDANEIDLKSNKKLRYDTQTKAIRTCDKLSCLVEMSMNLNLIGSDMAKNWQKLICDVKYMTISWRTKNLKC